MIVVGVILLLIGLLAGIGILTIIGAVLAVVGLILWALGSARTGGRRWY